MRHRKLTALGWAVVGLLAAAPLGYLASWLGGR